MRSVEDSLVVKAVAAEIKARRTALKISQEELADRADVHRSFIARLELAQTQPSLVVLFRLGQGLESEVSDLVASIAQRHKREVRLQRKPK